jgi:hypothetical protein
MKQECYPIPLRHSMSQPRWPILQNSNRYLEVFLGFRLLHAFTRDKWRPAVGLVLSKR